MKMSHQQKYYYNEHDESQVKKILKTKKKKRLKRRIKILLFLIVFVCIGSYFLSDYSKVKSITVVGNQEVSETDIVENISVDKNSFYLFVNTDHLEKEIKSLPLIKKAKVSKDLLGNIKVEIEEAEKVAYCIIDKITYVIDELGAVVETTDKDVIASLQATPRMTGFKDLKFLEKFAKEYVRLPELIKSQTSDIVYSPLTADETRMKFLMDDGKILYLRVEDMVEQLNKFDYEANKTAYSDQCVFKFEGKNVYMEKCK